MGLAVAVDGCELKDVIGNGSVEIKSSPSDKNFAEGKGIYFGTINISVSGSNGGGAITNKDGQGTGTLTGTGSSICDASSGQPAVLVEDSAVVMVSGHAGQTQVGPIPVTVKVTDAGQDKVIAL